MLRPKSYWAQLFERQAESPWATLVDPDHDFEEDRRKLREGLLEAGWPERIIENLINERVDDPSPSTGNSPGIAKHVESNFNRLCDDVESAMDILGHAVSGGMSI